MGGTWKARKNVVNGGVFQLQMFQAFFPLRNTFKK